MEREKENRIIDQTAVEAFCRMLVTEERSQATIEKYERDLRKLAHFLGEDGSVTKERMIAYKQKLKEGYKDASANSILAAANCFLKFRGWYDCMVKSIRIQRESFRSPERELTKQEYYALLDAARRGGKERLYYVMQAICSTGIRVSALSFITVEAVRSGRAHVSLKGKSRTVLLPKALCRDLARYAERRGIRSGSIFVTRNGKPLDRSNILHEMKALSDMAGVDRKKIFPHNLRHLFAFTYYEKEKDLLRLADILGHSNVNTTRIYTMTSGREQEKQLEQLGLASGIPFRKEAA